MQFQVKQSDLAKALGVVCPATLQYGSVPVLGNVLIETDGGDGVILRGTNNDSTISCWLPQAKVKVDGRLTAPARQLRRVVSLLDTGQYVEIKADRSRLVLTQGKRTLTLPGIAAEEFPETATFGEFTSVVLQSSELLAALRRVVVAADDSDCRPALNGVLFHFADDQLRLVTADGYRIHTERFDAASDLERELIVPLPAVRHLLRMLRGAKTVEVLVAKAAPPGQQVRFAVGDITLTTRTVEAKFPNYRSIIPTSHKTRVTVAVGWLLWSVRLAMVVASEGNNIVSLAIDDKAIEVSAKVTDGGFFAESVDAHTEGPAINIAFNGAWLTQALVAMPGEWVNLDLTESGRPMVLGWEDVEAFQAVVMPMHTGVRG